MSEQDFFFDEEDAKPAAEESKAPTGKPAQPSRQARSTSFFEQDISVSIAALMAVIALLIGIIIGVLIPTGGTATGALSSPAASTGVSSAPQLTQDQINSGALPAGHPDLSGADSGTATGSATTTGN